MINRLGRSVLAVLLVTLVAACAGGSPSPMPTTPPDSPTPLPSPSAAPAATPTLSPIPPTTPSPTPAPTLPPPPTFTPLPPTTESPLGPWEPLPLDGLPGSCWVQDALFAMPIVAFIVADGDVYRSDDAGATWSLSLSLHRGLRSLAASPAFATDRTVFAVDGHGLLLRSTDGGGTWQEVSRIAPIGGASDADVYLSISPAYPADPTLWAVVEGSVAYRSTDGGLTWEEFDPGVPLAGAVRLVPGPNYPDDPWLEPVALAPVEGVSLPQDLPSPPTVLAASGGTLLLGTTRGLYRSTDGGGTWARADAGLPRAGPDAVAVAPDGALYGVADSGRLFRLPPGGARWEPLGRLPEGDSGPPAVYRVNASAPPALVVTTDVGLLVSYDGGWTWARAGGEGLPPTRPSRSEPLPSADFAESGLAYLVHLGKVYRTTDGGDSWVQVEGLLGVEQLAETPDGRWIGLARSTVYERDPETGRWASHPADFGGKLSAVRFVTGQLAVAVVDEDFHLSQDGGRSWTRIGESNLDYAYGYLISPRFDVDRAIYARGATAIYVSTDAGRTWVETVEGLPPCEYYDSPECDVVLLGGARTDTGYTLYASVRHDSHTRIWSARAITDDD